MTPARRGAPTGEGGGTDCLGVLVVVPGSLALAGGSSGPYRRIKSGTSFASRRSAHLDAGCLRRSVLSCQMTGLSAVIASIGRLPAGEGAV